MPLCKKYISFILLMKSGINFRDFKISETSLLSYLVVAEMVRVYQLCLLCNCFSLYFEINWLKILCQLLSYHVIRTLSFHIVFGSARLRLPRRIQSIVRQHHWQRHLPGIQLCSIEETGETWSFHVIWVLDKQHLSCLRSCSDPGDRIGWRGCFCFCFYFCLRRGFHNYYSVLRRLLSLGRILVLEPLDTPYQLRVLYILTLQEYHSYQ